jgi:hypothetical protein
VRIVALGLLGCLVPFLGGCGKVPPPSAVAVRGKVVFADGKPVKGMVLSLHPADEATKLARMPTTLLPEDGRFAVECLPGRYKATLVAVPKSAGAAATEGPGGVPGPGVPKAGGTLMIDPKTALMNRHADAAQTPLVVDVPSGGASDVVLIVR